MSKTLKRILMAGLALCVVGAILTAAGLFLGGNEYVKAADLNRLDGAAMKSDTAAVMEKTKIDEIKGVNIEFDYMDFKIAPSEDDEYYLEYAMDAGSSGAGASDSEMAGREAALSWDVKDGVLSMNEEAADGLIIGLPDVGALFGGEKSPQVENRATLYIPEGSQLTDSVIHLNDGDFTADGADFSAAEITVEYGDTELTDTALQGGRVQIGDGDLAMDGTEISGTEISVEYGNISAVGGLLQDTYVQVADGNVKCTDTLIRDDCGIAAEYGDVELALTADCLETLQLQLSVEYGKIAMDEAVSRTIDGDRLESGDAAQFARNPENPAGSLKIVVEDGNIIIQ